MFFDAIEVLKKKFPNIKCTDERIANLLEKVGATSEEAVAFCESLDGAFINELSRRSALGGKIAWEALITEEFVKFRTRRARIKNLGWFEKLWLGAFGRLRI